MYSTDILKEEHRTIRTVLTLVNSLCTHLETGQTVSPSVLAEVVDFIREFADRLRHGKEEDLLFPAMVAAGIPKEGGPIGVMLYEHEEGRRYVKAMVDALSQKDTAAYIQNARNYTHLLDQHIFKEDNILYPMADRSLSPDQQQELEREYARVEQELDGPARRSQAEELIQRLTADYGNE